METLEEKMNKIFGEMTVLVQTHLDIVLDDKSPLSNDEKISYVLIMKKHVEALAEVWGLGDKEDELLH